MGLLGCVECGWTGKSDERRSFDAGDGLTLLLCPDCGKDDFIEVGFWDGEIMEIEKEKCAHCGAYVMYLMGGQCADCIAAEDEQARYDAMSDADKAEYDAYHNDDGGWLDYHQRMEQQRGH